MPYNPDADWYIGVPRRRGCFSDSMRQMGVLQDDIQHVWVCLAFRTAPGSADEC
jgi:hypothetical protein